MDGADSLLDELRCRKCRYLVAKTDRVCGRCGAPITTKNVLFGHATGFAAACGGGLYLAAMGFANGFDWVGLLGIFMMLNGTLGVVRSVRKVLRLRDEFPTARARLTTTRTSRAADDRPDDPPSSGTVAP